MLKVVVDTNVFISGLLKSPINRQIIILLKEKRFNLIISKEILDEFIDVMGRPKFNNVIKRDTIAKLIELIKNQAVIVNPQQKFNVVKDDFDDNKFLEAAFEAKANFIVSGDKHLLSLKEFNNISIITSEEFLKNFL